MILMMAMHVDIHGLINYRMGYVKSSELCFTTFYGEMMEKDREPAKRGRPARLSREQILQAALKLLEKGPAEVTLNSVARALKVAPMSLYTHVENRDDLLQGVGGLVLAKLQLKLHADNWEGNVRLWAEQVQAHFKRYPQIVKLMGESKQLSVQWMRVEAQLVTVLEQAGLRGDDLISTSNMLSQAVIFECMRAVALEKDGIKLQHPDLSELSDEDTRSAELVFQYTPSGGHSLLEFVLEQLLKRAHEILQRKK